MTNKIIIGVIIAILVGIIIYLIPKKSDNITPYYSRIDSLSKQIDSLSLKRDSINRQIDTVSIILNNTYIKYEKARNTIINNTTGEDFLFFQQYIDENKQRLDSANNL